MSTHNAQYLESKVLTAPSYRLHLMLIEGALRFGRQADDRLRQGDTVGASGQLLRLIDIVGELLAGVRECKSEINKKLTDLYWFLFRCVSEAKINSDATRLGEALRLLEIERQTWLAVCEKFESGEVPMSRSPSSGSQPLSLEA